MKHHLICKVEKGKLLYDADLLKKYLERYEGKEVFVTIQRFDSEKTSAQRSFYFASVVQEAAEHFGWEVEDMHSFLKEECNKKELVNSKTGEVYHVAGSTVPLRKMEMAAFIDRAIRRLAQEGYVVRTPDEYFASIRHQEERNENSARGRD